MRDYMKPCPPGILPPAIPPFNFSDPIEQSLILRHVVPGSIPVFRFVGDTPHELGTGTIFNIDGVHLLVTAAHVVTKLSKDECIVLIGEGGRCFRVQCTCASVAEPDVAVLRLSEESVAQLPKGQVVLGLRDVVDFREPFFYRNEFILCGFPVASQVIDRERADLNPLVYRCVAYEGTPPEEVDLVWERPFIRGVDFLLHLDEEGRHHDGTSGPIPPLNGMSGCPQWGMVPGTVPGGMKIFGIQTAVLRRRWVRCTMWGVVAGLICRAWPELRETIRDHFGDVIDEDVEDDLKESSSSAS